MLRWHTDQIGERGDERRYERTSTFVCGVTSEDGLADAKSTARSFHHFLSLLKRLSSVQIIVPFSSSRNAFNLYPASENGLYSGISMLHIVSFDLLKSSMRH